jgi:hypothetical protein
MAQGEFTKEEADETKIAVEEMFNAIPKRKKLEYLGHFNDIMLFIDVARKNAPNEQVEEEAV